MEEKFIIGLGNPGKEYESTRHNIGFLLLDFLKKEWMFPDFTYDKYSKSLKTSSTFLNHKITLMKPQTFMNLSGESISSLKTKTPLNNFLILYDDFDLDLGTFRIKAKGSGGSHNGMKSILNIAKDLNIPRLRIGIKPNHPVGNAANFVLGKFSKLELKTIFETSKNIEEATSLFIKNNLEEAFQKFNRKNK